MFCIIFDIIFYQIGHDILKKYKCLLSVISSPVIINIAITIYRARDDIQNISMFFCILICQI